MATPLGDTGALFGRSVSTQTTKITCGREHYIVDRCLYNLNPDVSEAPTPRK